MPSAVILTALPVEYAAVRAHLSNLQDETHPQGKFYERGYFEADKYIWDVGIAEVGVGNTKAAIETERAITYFQPEIIFFVGIAGGIKDVKVGDVVAATKVYDYEGGKSEGEIFCTRPEVEKSDYSLVEHAKREARKGNWLYRLDAHENVRASVFVAPIAAGAKVIASRKSDIFQFLRTIYNDAIAVEMEGFGFLNAVFANHNTKAIVIRGISDIIEGKNDDSPESGQSPESLRQQQASEHASAFAFEILSKIVPQNKLEIALLGIVEPSTNKPEISTRDQQEQKDEVLKFPFVQDSLAFTFFQVQVDELGTEVSRYQKETKYVLEKFNSINIKMMVIPGGSFIMGSSEIKPFPSETPQRKLEIKPFLMSQYPITKKQWKTIAMTDQINRKIKKVPVRKGSSNHPVVNVSWHDVVEFCDRLSTLTGKKYRLPTEAEWEYACRAGTRTPFHFGNNISCTLVNYDGSHQYHQNQIAEINRGKSTAVDTFPYSNRFGLYDMHGNVFEWCQDSWHNDYQEAPQNTSAWEEKGSRTRVIRGGSWRSEARLCRSGYRAKSNADRCVSHVGFRIIRDL